MSICEACRRKRASVGCLCCRRDMCDDCFAEHMLRVSADMDEGFQGLKHETAANDQSIICEICGISVESEKKEHLYSEHGMSI
jgi:hypothetical protein